MTKLENGSSKLDLPERTVRLLKQKSYSTKKKEEKKVVQHFNITILIVTHVHDVVNRSCENLEILIITLQSLAQGRAFFPLEGFHEG